MSRGLGAGYIQQALRRIDSSHPSTTLGCEQCRVACSASDVDDMLVSTRRGTIDHHLRRWKQLRGDVLVLADIPIHRSIRPGYRFSDVPEEDGRSLNMVR